MWWCPINKKCTEHASVADGTDKPNSIAQPYVYRVCYSVGHFNFMADVFSDLTSFRDRAFYRALSFSFLLALYPALFIFSLCRKKAPDEDVNHPIDGEPRIRFGHWSDHRPLFHADQIHPATMSIEIWVSSEPEKCNNFRRPTKTNNFSSRRTDAEPKNEEFIAWEKYIWI